jgi:hypothetical protein
MWCSKRPLATGAASTWRRAERGALMTRMGHDSMRAALIYKHKTQGADRKIADAMEAVIEAAIEKDASDAG